MVVCKCNFKKGSSMERVAVWPSGYGTQVGSKPFAEWGSIGVFGSERITMVNKNSSAT
jgi:hypothetical protein